MGGYGSQGSGLLVLCVVLVLVVCADVSVCDVTEGEKHQSSGCPDFKKVTAEKERQKWAVGQGKQR